MTSVERLTTEKLRDRKMSSGTSGFFRTAISTGNATSATAPIPSAANASGSCHACCWPRVAPKASPPTATMATTAPSQSNRPVAPSLRDSGTARSAIRAMTTSGRLMRNAARHETCWTVSWRAAFLINLPLVVIALIALRAVPESRNEGATGRFDWLGAVVAIVAVGGLAFGATRGQQQAWQDPLAFAALGIGAVALVAFPVLM